MLCVSKFPNNTALFAHGGFACCFPGLASTNDAIGVTAAFNESRWFHTGSCGASFRLFRSQRFVFVLKQRRRHLEPISYQDYFDTKTVKKKKEKTEAKIWLVSIKPPQQKSSLLPNRRAKSLFSKVSVNHFLAHYCRMVSLFKPLIKGEGKKSFAS